MTDTIGYVRVSTEQQAGEQKLSLSEQRRHITEFALKLGRVLSPEMIFEDPGVSGATAEGRPGFMAMLSYCEQHQRSPVQRGTVVVLNDSRFGRFDDPEEATHWRFVLKRLGWLVRFVDADEVQDPTARSVIRVIQSAQATQYRQNLRVTAKRAARATAEQGRWQQEAPLGYRRLATRPDGAQRVMEIGQRKAPDEVSRLTPGPENEQEVIRWIFENYASGERSIHGMVKELDRKFPYRRWSTGTVGAILQNPAYVGDVVWCRRVTDKTERLERTVRDRSEWVVVRDAHPAIISRETFQQAQDRKALNKKQTRATAGAYPLSGIICCGTCGSAFAGGGGAKGPPEDPNRFRFYKDVGSQGRTPVCAPPMMTLRKHWVEGVVIDEVARHVASPEVQSKIGRRVRELVAGAQSGSADRRASLERDRGKIVEQRSRLVGSIASGVVQEREAAALMAEIRSRLESIDAEIEKSRFADRATHGLDREIKRIAEVAKDFPSTVRKMSGVQLREALKPWIRSAVVNKEKRVLTLELWKVPAAARVLHLADSLPPASQKQRIRELVVRRRIKLPPIPAVFIASYNRRRAAGGGR